METEKGNTMTRISFDPRAHARRDLAPMSVQEARAIARHARARRPYGWTAFVVAAIAGGYAGAIAAFLLALP
jgi:hypothetical protein